MVVSRFVGYDGERIAFLSDMRCKMQGVKLMRVPRTLDRVSDRDITNKYIVWQNQLIRRDGPRPLARSKIALVIPKDIKLPYRPCKAANFQKFDSRTSLLNLIDDIELYSPDSVLIYYKPEYFPNIRQWLFLMSSLQKYRTVVILPEVSKDEGIAEAVMSEIVVLSEEHANLLREKNLASTVRVSSDSEGLFEQILA